MTQTHNDYLWFPITDEQRAVLMITILMLIALFFVVKNIPVKRKDVWHVHDRNRKKAKKTGKDGKR